MDRPAMCYPSRARRHSVRRYESPVVVDGPPRDELATKVLIAVAAEHVDITALLQRQRTAAIGQLQEYTRQKAHTDVDRDLPWLLLLDALILRTESEIRWLDMCEARLRRRTAGRPDAGQS